MANDLSASIETHFASLADRACWKGLKQISVAISETIRNGKPCDDVCCYILILNKCCLEMIYGAIALGLSRF